MRRAIGSLLVLVLVVAAGACSSGPGEVRADARPAARNTTASTRSAAGCDPATDPLTGGTLVHGGVERAHNVTFPPGEGPFPVVLNLHGVSGDRHTQDGATGLPVVGFYRGFATVTPESAPGHQRWDLEPDGRDVGYLRALLDRLAASPCVDARRIYAVGFSNGAMMAIQLACLHPDRLAAVGAVGGLVALDACAGADPAGPPPPPLVVVHGTADPSVGYDGRLSPRVVPLAGYERGPSVAALAAVWAARRGCTAAPVTTVLGPDVRFDHCDDVTLVAVEGAGHVWPGRAAGTELDANELLWSFFEPRTIAG